MHLNQSVTNCVAKRAGSAKLKRSRDAVDVTLSHQVQLEEL